MVLLTAVVGVGCAPKRTLRVGTSGDYPPFSVAEEGGARHGFDIDIAQAYAEDRGLRLEIVPFRWPELESRLLAGEFDVAMSGVTVRGDRLARAPMTSAVARADAIVLTRRNAPRGSLDRAGVVIAVNRGGHLERLARASFREATIQPVEDNRSLPDLLSGRRVHAVVTDSLEARSFEFPTRVRQTLAHDRKAYWVAPQREELVLDLNQWIGTKAATRWLETKRTVWMDDPQRSALRAADATLVDHLAQRLLVMPLVAEVKRERQLPVDAPGREAAIEERARAAAEKIGLNEEAYLRLVRAEFEAAKAVQSAVLESPATVAGPLPDLGDDLRPAIDRIDRAIRATLLWAAPVQATEEELVAALRKNAPVPGLEEAHLRELARAALAIPGARSST